MNLIKSTLYTSQVSNLRGISGKTCASQRPEFARLLEKIRDGETIVVSKLDRLGRDSIDVLQTVRMLSDRQIKVIVHQLGQTDLTSPAGKLLLTMLSAVASRVHQFMGQAC